MKSPAHRRQTSIDSVASIASLTDSGLPSSTANTPQETTPQGPMGFRPLSEYNFNDPSTIPLLLGLIKLFSFLPSRMRLTFWNLRLTRCFHEMYSICASKHHICEIRSSFYITCLLWDHSDLLFYKLEWYMVFKPVKSFSLIS